MSITLFCLVQGAPTAFPVDIDSSLTVGHLKKAIKAEKAPEFDSFAADRLRLWKVEIPDDSDDLIQGQALQDNNQLLPTRRLVRYWTDTPPTSSLPIARLTARQLLDCTPCPISYKPDVKPGTSTTSIYGITPQSVTKWEAFIYNANEMVIDDSSPEYDKPAFKNYRVKELDVQVALQSNVLEALEFLLLPNEEFERTSTLKDIIGQPDYILQANSKVVLPIEVKTKWILNNGDIVGQFNNQNRPVCVHNSISQIFGYMGYNKCQYGVLSTYDKTWFLRRPKADCESLLVSEVVGRSGTSPTLLRCFAYIMSLARQDSECPAPKISAKPSEDDYEPPEESDGGRKDPNFKPSKGPSSGSGKGRQGSRRGGADKKGDESSTRHQYNTREKREALGNMDLNRRELRLEKFGWDSFEVNDALGQGRCGNVFKGTLRGEKVVIKLCDLWQHPELHKEMLRETRTYVELGKLQGHGIPKLKGVGYTAGGLFALMTEFAGWPIKAENLNDDKRQMIVGVLASIHAEGFLHGDLRCENILIEHYNDDPRITFIDFGFARKFSNHKQSESEMAALRKMIGFRSMKKPRIE